MNNTLGKANARLVFIVIFTEFSLFANRGNQHDCLNLQTRKILSSALKFL